MDVNVNGELIKLLRSQRSWSQDELASVSGLSIRTVQRIEISGACSLESKKALASVFEIEAKSLEIDDHAIAMGIQNTKGTRYGYIGAGIGLLSAYSAITYSLLTGSMSGDSAGLYYGVIGAICGICVAIIGVVSKRQQRSQ